MENRKQMLLRVELNEDCHLIHRSENWFSASFVSTKWHQIAANQDRTVSGSGKKKSTLIAFGAV